MWLDVFRAHISILYDSQNQFSVIHSESLERTQFNAYKSATYIRNECALCTGIESVTEHDNDILIWRLCEIYMLIVQ